MAALITQPNLVNHLWLAKAGALLTFVLIWRHDQCGVEGLEDPYGVLVQQIRKRAQRPCIFGPALAFGWLSGVFFAS